MLSTARSSPGVLIISSAQGGADGPAWFDAARALGPESRVALETAELRVICYGLPCDGVSWAQSGVATLLTRGARRHEHEVGAVEAGDVLKATRWERAELLPPFAAFELSARTGEVRAAADWLGFRQLYVRQGAGWAALSTSARALAALSPTSFDRFAVGTQCLLGWQLDLQTPFEGVRKLERRAVATLRSGRLMLESDAVADPVNPMYLADAITHASRILRDYLAAYLDQNPDALLQLTGGLDSRTLLAAIPAARRHGLEVMTVAVPGSQDQEIAASLATRYGMVHRVATFAGLDDADPSQIYEVATAMARRLELQADPVAATPLAWAEGQIDQRPRLVGLGGEVTRGFYYFGPGWSERITRARAERLAKWRLFSNGSVPKEVLVSGFFRDAYEQTVEIVRGALESTGPRWSTSTDEFYLTQRMHRWAGVVSSGTCFDRVITNPMLDDRFIGIARGLSPSDKRNMRFLSRLLLALDDELGDQPLDGRPSPRVYAAGGLPSRALGVRAGRRLARKARQRLTEARRPPAGAAIVARKLSEYWRHHPEDLDPIRGYGIFDERFLDEVSRGTTAADPASAGVLVNLVVASRDVAAFCQA